MDFTCAHCNKPINGLSVLIDKEHILHAECKNDFVENSIEYANALAKVATLIEKTSPRSKSANSIREALANKV